MSIKRVLIVGLGSVGHKHLDIATRVLPKSEITVLSSSTKYSNSSVNFLKSLNEALEFQPNLTLICNPAPMHVQIAQIFAELNSHLFIEKPISSNLIGVRKLLDTCKRKNLIVQTGYNLRFSKSLQEFRKIILSGILGDIFEIQATAGQYLPDWRPERDYRTTVSAQKTLGGGVLLELSHEIDYLRWIFGEVNCVSGSLSTTSNLEIDVEDTANFKLGFKHWASGKDLVADVSLDFIRKIPERLCKVVGESGVLEWNGLMGEVVFSPKNDGRIDKFSSEDVGFGKTYVDEWESLIHCITTGDKPLVTGEDGLRVVEIIEAIREANVTGAKVDVMYDKTLGDF